MSVSAPGESASPAPDHRAAAVAPVVGVTVFGIELLYGGDLRSLVETAVQAESAGIGQVVLPDHVVIGPRTDRYPFGVFPAPPDRPWAEPLAILAAIAS